MTNLLAEAPEALFKILMSLLLVPKTLFKVMIAPRWIPGYIKTELKKPPTKKRFDEYSHPITFFASVAVAPLIPLLLILPHLSNTLAGETFKVSFLPGLLPAESITVPSDFSRDIQEQVGAFKSLSLEKKFAGLFLFLVSCPLAVSVIIQPFRSFELRRRARIKSAKKKKTVQPDIAFSGTSVTPIFFTQFYFFSAFYFYQFLAFAVELFTFRSPVFHGLNVALCYGQLYFAYSLIQIIQEETNATLLRSFLILFFATGSGSYTFEARY